MPALGTSRPCWSTPWSVLLESTHTGFEIIVIVGHDDPETAEVAHRVAATAPGASGGDRHQRA
ncbi:hypothetical protein [Actinoplanes nipponensis]|uniref:hypothetical protein n=1 Tax=Actinoplanes nipponensis TaxID=135950 RepID=UPI0031E8E8E4